MHCKSLFKDEIFPRYIKWKKRQVTKQYDSTFINVYKNVNSSSSQWWTWE